MPLRLWRTSGIVAPQCPVFDACSAQRSALALTLSWGAATVTPRRRLDLLDSPWSSHPSQAIGATVAVVPFVRPAVDGGAYLRAAVADVADVNTIYAAASAASRVGRIAEIVHAATFNLDAAVRGSSTRAWTTHGLGDPTSPADVVFTGGDAGPAQIKFYATPDANTANFAREVYVGMQKVAPMGQEQAIRMLALRRSEALAERNPVRAAAMRDTAESIADRLTGPGGLSSSPLSREAAFAIMRDPSLLERRALAVEIAHALPIGVAFSAAVAGASVLARDPGAPPERVARALVQGGVSGAAHAVGTAITRQLLLRSVPRLAGGAGAAVITGVSLEAGAVVCSWARGEIDSDELTSRVARSLARGAAGWGGAAVGAGIGGALGPIGSVVGWCLGGLLGSASL